MPKSATRHERDHSAKPPVLDETIAARVPAHLLRQIDAVAFDAMCPRSYAIRCLLARAVKASKVRDFFEEA